MAGEKKSAAEKAQEAVDVATRKRDRTKAKVDSLRADLTEQVGLLDVQEAELAFLASHPALKVASPKPEDNGEGDGPTASERISGGPHPGDDEVFDPFSN